MGVAMKTGPFQRPSKQHFTGQWCRLERTTLAHADALHAAFGQRDANWDYLPYGPFPELRDFRAWLVKTCLDHDPMFFTVLVDNKPVGILALMRQDPQNGVVEVGHVHFAPALQRSPASTEAQAILMGYIFDDLGYRRYEWKCNAQNAPSRKAAERLGFSYEGTFRQHMIVKGQNRDTAWFSILDHEWPAQKARFETWLRPGNFDRDGVQKTALLRAGGAHGDIGHR